MSDEEGADRDERKATWPFWGQEWADPALGSTARRLSLTELSAGMGGALLY
jgi:hypothetical protein